MRSGLWFRRHRVQGRRHVKRDLMRTCKVDGIMGTRLKPYDLAWVMTSGRLGGEPPQGLECKGNRSCLVAGCRLSLCSVL